jgi:hypothetical protein
MSSTETDVGSTAEKPERKTKKRFQSKSPHAPSDNGAVPRKKKRAEQAETLVAELTLLRATMDEMIEHYRLRIGGEIAELIDAVHGGNGVAHAPPAKVTSALLLELRETQLKAQKGRGKDLVRLQQLVRRLGELLPPED